MTVVVDASVACKWLIEEEGSTAAAALLAVREALVAPDLIVAEVASVLWRKATAGAISPAHAASAVVELPGQFDELVPASALARRALTIALALGHPAYDCLYLALAEARGAHLVTADERLVARLHGTEWETLALPPARAAARWRAGPRYPGSRLPGRAR